MPRSDRQRQQARERNLRPLALANGANEHHGQQHQQRRGARRQQGPARDDAPLVRVLVHRRGFGSAHEKPAGRDQDQFQLHTVKVKRPSRRQVDALGVLGNGFRSVPKRPLPAGRLLRGE